MQENYSYKADIWSIGIIYFELLYGFVPWKGLNASTYVKRVLEDPRVKFPNEPQISNLS